MQEYFGDSAQKYGQPLDKYFTLFPALEDVISKAKKGQFAIDLGCGSGILYEMITSKGYSYTGVDISPDMLAQAQQKYPHGTFHIGDVTKPLSQISQRFNLVIANMVLPSLELQSEFDGLFTCAQTLLADNGILVVTTGHPCFDGYMQKHFFERPDIETEFNGYENSGALYKIQKSFEDKTFVFQDFHRTLSDYYASVQKAGLQIEGINECPLVGDPPAEVVEKVTKKGAPSFMIFLIKEKKEKTSS